MLERWTELLQTSALQCYFLSERPWSRVSYRGSKRRDCVQVKKTRMGVWSGKHEIPNCNMLECRLVDIRRVVNSVFLISRELVDAECYRLAYDFVCQLLQPACIPGKHEDRLELPCRNFCREFWAGCGSRLPDRIREALDCSHFPEYSGPGSCRPKPGDNLSLKNNGSAAPRENLFMRLSHHCYLSSMNTGLTRHQGKSTSSLNS